MNKFFLAVPGAVNLTQGAEFGIGAENEISSGYCESSRKFPGI